MSYIYLVILTAGYSCCDQLSRTLRAFTAKGEAESYMDDMRHQISRNMGLRHAVDAYMSDVWGKVNPAPTPCPSWDNQRSDEENEKAYKDHQEAYNTYSDARHAEETRMLSLVGWKCELDLRWEEQYDLHIQEVPLGVEEVKGGGGRGGWATQNEAAE